MEEYYKALRKEQIKKLREIGTYMELDGERVLVLPQGASVLEDTLVIYDEYDEKRIGRRANLGNVVV